MEFWSQLHGVVWWVSLMVRGIARAELREYGSLA